MARNFAPVMQRREGLAPVSQRGIGILIRHPDPAVDQEAVVDSSSQHRQVINKTHR